MIPVAQTSFGPRVGDCFRACVASVLELPGEEVPHFFCAPVLEAGAGWWDFFLDWCWLRGVEIFVYYPENRDDGTWLHKHPGRWWERCGGCVPPSGYSILTGLSPRNYASGVMHAVVCLNGVLAHDPRTDDPRGVLSAYEWMVLRPTRPWRAAPLSAERARYYRTRNAWRRLAKGKMSLEAAALVLGCDKWHIPSAHDYARRELRAAGNHA